jgi:ring-1,2-phenylacetyl-CoA epoxidase subunit PaaD
VVIESTLQAGSLALAQQVVNAVCDPEIPVITLFDLGVVRDVCLNEQGVCVELTPTYSGCPATEVIKDSVRQALLDAGFKQVQILMSLNPPWSTDRITEKGKNNLREYGIAPPNQCLQSQNVSQLTFFAPNVGVACPRCSSNNTEKISQFGSTPCKALYRCITCREPFDYFKPY